MSWKPVTFTNVTFMCIVKLPTLVIVHATKYYAVKTPVKLAYRLWNWRADLHISRNILRERHWCCFSFLGRLNLLSSMQQKGTFAIWDDHKISWWHKSHFRPKTNLFQLTRHLVPTQNFQTTSRVLKPHYFGLQLGHTDKGKVLGDHKDLTTGKFCFKKIERKL